MTCRIATFNPDEDFLPTVVVPERDILLVLDGMPADRMNGENVILWARAKADDASELFVAFRSSPEEIQVFRITDDDKEVQTICA
jgi:hypothetical protein